MLRRNRNEKDRSVAHLPPSHSCLLPSSTPPLLTLVEFEDRVVVLPQVHVEIAVVPRARAVGGLEPPEISDTTGKECRSLV